VKIDEAIELLKSTPIQVVCEDDLKYAEARQLSIEALKRLQDNRRDPEFDHWIPLPGETED